MIKNTFVVNTNYGGVGMSELEELLKDIDTLRIQLEHLINKKQGNLVDQEVVTVTLTHFGRHDKLVLY